MATTATRSDSTVERRLYLSFELSASSWLLHFSTAAGEKPRKRRVKARDLGALEVEIAKARERFGLPADVEVVSCYEAGRDGFWLHRYLESRGIRNRVVDAGSIDRKARRRRVKTDRLDGERLLQLLIRFEETGEKVWSVVRVPDVAAEDRRQIHRELAILQGEIRAHQSRITSLLITQGLELRLDRRFLERLSKSRLVDGSPLPELLRRRLEREWARLEYSRAQRLELERERRELLRESRAPAIEQSRRLMQLRGIGVQGGWILPMEIFSWREIRNRRQLAGLVGLCGTPFQSGGSSREQGIDKAGIARVRTLAVELAWGWLRHQPDSELSRWYRERFGSGGSRMRRIGIVALARRLLIALWRYLEDGLVPQGARLKPAR